MAVHLAGPRRGVTSSSDCPGSDCLGSRHPARRAVVPSSVRAKAACKAVGLSAAVWAVLLAHT